MSLPFIIGKFQVFMKKPDTIHATRSDKRNSTERIIEENLPAF
jgi:hypothetical protein